MLLLDAMPIASWLGGVTTLLVAILGYFLRNAHNAMTKKQEELENDISHLKKQVNDDNRDLENKLHNTHIILLEKLQDVINTFNNARKQ